MTKKMGEENSREGGRFWGGFQTSNQNVWFALRTTCDCSKNILD